MKKLKFRAWDNKFCCFLNVSQVFINLEVVVCAESCDDGSVCAFDNQNALTIEQFTGLYDKNGREIYEGDILKDKYENSGTVHWYGSGFEFINTSGMLENGDDWSVVGNIHENKELLEQNDETSNRL